MELKPCPFCGKAADVYYRCGKHGEFAYVKCESCDAQTRAKSVKGNPDADPEFWDQIAIRELENLWNMRTKGRDNDG